MIEKDMHPKNIKLARYTEDDVEAMSREPLIPEHDRLNVRIALRECHMHTLDGNVQRLLQDKEEFGMGNITFAFIVEGFLKAWRRAQ